MGKRFVLLYGANKRSWHFVAGGTPMGQRFDIWDIQKVMAICCRRQANGKAFRSIIWGKQKVMELCCRRHTNGRLFYGANKRSWQFVAGGKPMGQRFAARSKNKNVMALCCRGHTRAPTACALIGMA